MLRLGMWAPWDSGWSFLECIAKLCHFGSQDGHFRNASADLDIFGSQDGHFSECIGELWGEFWFVFCTSNPRFWPILSHNVRRPQLCLRCLMYTSKLSERIQILTFQIYATSHEQGDCNLRKTDMNTIIKDDLIISWFMIDMDLIIFDGNGIMAVVFVYNL